MRLFVMICREQIRRDREERLRASGSVPPPAAAPAAAPSLSSSSSYKSFITF